MRAPINRATSESFPQRFSSQHRQAHPIIVAQIVSHRNIAQSASVRHRSLKKCHLRVSSRNCVYTPTKQTNGGNGCVWIVVLRIDPCMWSVEPRETKKSACACDSRSRERLNRRDRIVQQILESRTTWDLLVGNCEWFAARKVRSFYCTYFFLVF